MPGEIEFAKPTRVEYIDGELVYEEDLDFPENSETSSIKFVSSKQNTLKDIVDYLNSIETNLSILDLPFFEMEGKPYNPQNFF